MKKKRILSLLLAATLIASSVPLTSLAASGKGIAADDVSSAVKIGTEGWLANGTEPTEVIPQTIDGNVPTSYRRIADKTDKGWYMVQFWNGNWSFNEGSTYRMTIWLRRSPDAAYTGDALPGLHMSIATSYRDYWSLSGYDSKLATDAFTAIINEGNADYAQNADHMLTLTDEWNKYTVDFTMKKTLTTQHNGIYFFDTSGKGPGFDIGGFSLGLVDTSTGKQTNELIPSDFLTSEKYLSDKSNSPYGVTIETRSDKASMRAPAALDNTNITYTPDNDVVLTPGVYEFTGDFKLGVLDYSDAAAGNFGANASAYINGEKLGEIALDQNWVTKTFIYSVDTAIKLSELKIELDDTLALDYKNLSFTQSEKYSYSDEWTTNGNGPVEIITDINGDGETNEHIHVSNNLTDPACIAYSDSTTTLDSSKLYKLTVRMRGTKTQNGERGMGIRILLGGVYGQAIAESGSIVKEGDYGYGAVLSDTWQTYTMIFQPSYTNLYLAFKRFYYAPDVLPYDIDDLSLVEVADDGNGNYTEVGAELIGGGSWINALGSAKIDTVSESSYFHVNAAQVSPTSGTLTPGVYEISADFRLGSVNYDYYTYNGQHGQNVATNYNFAKLTLSAGDAAVKTTDGAEYIELTPESWTSVKYTLKVGASGFDLENLKFAISAQTEGYPPSDFDFRNFIITNASADYNTDFVDGEGNFPRKHYNTFSETYIHVTGRDHYMDVLEYTTGTNLFAGTYMVTFLVRTAPFIPSSGDIAAKPAIIRMMHGSSVANSSIVMTEEWESVSTEITLTEDAPLTFYLNGSSSGYGYGPFDIGGLSIVEIDPVTKDVISDELAVNADGLISGGAGWRAKGDTYYGADDAALYFDAVTATDSLSHNVIVKPASGNTTLASLSTNCLAAGYIYHITGKFRVHDIDYNNFVGNTSYMTEYNVTPAKLTAKLGDTALKTVDGETSVSLENEWVTVTFLAKPDVSAELSSLVFDFGGAYSIDFGDIEILQASELYLNSWESEDGTPAIIVNETLDTVNGTVGEADTNTYVHFYNRNHALTAAMYTDPNVTVTAGQTYKLSFWARVANVENIDSSNPAKGKTMRIANSAQNWPGAAENLSNESNALYREGSFVSSGPLMSTDWQKYTIVFVADETEQLNMRFYGGGYNEDLIPVDIDGISLIPVDSETFEPTGTELIRNSEELAGSNIPGWKTFTFYPFSASIRIDTEREYYSVSPSSEDSTVIVNTEDVVLEPGTYQVKGSFRLPSTDYADYTFKTVAGYSVVDSAAANTANISAYIGDTAIALKTLSGTDSYTVSNEWTDICFNFETIVPINLNTLKLVLDEAQTLHFRDIGVELIERHVTLADVNIGTIMTLLMLKKSYELAEDDSNGNLIAGAIEEKRLRNWSYGEQTLEYFTDENGSPYLAASDMTDNLTGFTYAPKKTLESGGYLFTGEFRTTNTGEKSTLRIDIGGNTAYTNITNEWKKVEFFVEVAKDVPLTVKVYGGPALNTTKDFEMRGFFLEDLSNNPIPQTLYNLDFEKENSISGWSTAGQGAGTFTWNQDDDGNGYMTVSDRLMSATPARKDVGLKLVKNATYVFEFDVRATNPGETSRFRFGIVWSMLNLDNPSDPSTPNLININDEWTHVTATYVATGDENLAMSFMTGPVNEDNISFDFDNFKITRLFGVRYEVYPAGDFEDESKSLIGWYTAGQGHADITWHRDEADGNGYIRIANRANAAVPLAMNFGYKQQPGKTYKISYDVRTANEGETMQLRTSMVWDIIPVNGGISAIEISNEWTHIECEYIASSENDFILMIKGGPRGEPDNKDFEIDNLVIEIE